MVSLFAGRSFAATRIVPDATFTRSVSGQFIIHDRRSGGASEIAAQLPATNSQYASFDSTVLAVSCERLKHDLWRELGSTSPGRDKIHVLLHPARFKDENIGITCERFRDSWRYIVDLPDVTDRVRYVRAMVQVVLQEFANRGAEARSAEIPVWLVEGLTRQLLASDGSEIILPPPRKNVNGIILTATHVNARKEDPLDQARRELRGNQHLTFEDLSWPKDNALAAESAKVFGLSAQIFVSELLQLEHGRERMCRMLTMLPDRYNWQIAFLGAFHEDFGRLLDVEKWWTLRLLHFLGREATQTWPLEESWRKLEQALRPAVEVRGSTNELPLPSETTLQGVVGAWETGPQTRTIEAKLRELQVLRPQLAPDVAPLADEYRQTLQSYLEQSRKSRSFLTIRKKKVYRQAQIMALERLNQLDARRNALRPRSEPLASTKQKPMEPLP